MMGAHTGLPQTIRPLKCASPSGLSFTSTESTPSAATVANLAVLFDRLDRAEIAATIYGTTTHNAGNAVVIGLPEALDHLRATLGDTVFDDCVATGAAMERGEAVQYVRAQIQAARNQLPAST